ncbi:MAG: hypothetical protein JWO36_4134 [Myxococcales bacterium]|nr:hypothetical protein [Myxococcales bacterium]
MIDEYSTDRTGWARFSDDRKLRYRLRRILTIRGLEIHDGMVVGLRIITFIMLNPSIADAFIVDPTVRKCVRFAQLWGADVLEVVNLHAWRATDPRELYKLVGDPRSPAWHVPNNLEILDACKPANRVIAAWGNHGELDGRAERVRELVADHGIVLEHLGLTESGYPLHPLARGKSHIPYEREPVVWA